MHGEWSGGGFMEHVPVIHPRVNLMVSGRRLLEYLTEDYIHTLNSFKNIIITKTILFLKFVIFYNSNLFD